MLIFQKLSFFARVVGKVSVYVSKSPKVKVKVKVYIPKEKVKCMLDKKQLFLTNLMFFKNVRNFFKVFVLPWKIKEIRPIHRNGLNLTYFHKTLLKIH